MKSTNDLLTEVVLEHLVDHTVSGTDSLSSVRDHVYYMHGFRKLGSNYDFECLLETLGFNITHIYKQNTKYPTVVKTLVSV